MAKKISKIHQRVLSASATSSATKSSINRKINKIIEDSMDIDRSGDAELLSKNDQSWDDLNNLRESLGSALLQLCQEIFSMSVNPEIQSVLGDRKTEFDKLMKTFEADSTSFSERVQEIRLQHEGRTGKLTSMQEYSEFTRLFLQYQNAHDELNALLAPTMSELVLLVHEQVAVAQAAKDATDPQVVTDVVVKN